MEQTKPIKDIKENRPAATGRKSYKPINHG